MARKRTDEKMTSNNKHLESGVTQQETFDGQRDVQFENLDVGRWRWGQLDPPDNWCRGRFSWSGGKDSFKTLKD